MEGKGEWRGRRENRRKVRGIGKGKEEEKARGKRRSVQRKEIERGHIIAMWKQ